MPGKQRLAREEMINIAQEVSGTIHPSARPLKRRKIDELANR